MVLRGGQADAAWRVDKFLLNTSYPFGNEDAEYCTTARKAGMRSEYVLKSEAWHKVGV